MEPLLKEQISSLRERNSLSYGLSEGGDKEDLAVIDEKANFESNLSGVCHLYCTLLAAKWKPMHILMDNRDKEREETTNEEERADFYMNIRSKEIKTLNIKKRKAYERDTIWKRRSERRMKRRQEKAKKPSDTLHLLVYCWRLILHRRKNQVNTMG
ncbi:unnamed protein product [Mytilus coruscus]|uniref:Uncharacterized protein n=1 Tax=Mytilus coruscus TaxID=42192 RepID=A0A6J8E844_MYTCO|nr:unnamed protein product [Mytilus coruscus]